MHRRLPLVSPRPPDEDLDTVASDITGALDQLVDALVHLVPQAERWPAPSYCLRSALQADEQRAGRPRGGHPERARSVGRDRVRHRNPRRYRPAPAGGGVMSTDRADLDLALSAVQQAADALAVAAVVLGVVPAVEPPEDALDLALQADEAHQRARAAFAIVFEESRRGTAPGRAVFRAGGEDQRRGLDGHRRGLPPGRRDQKGASWLVMRACSAPEVQPGRGMARTSPSAGRPLDTALGRLLPRLPARPRRVGAPRARAEDRGRGRPDDGARDRGRAWDRPQDGGGDRPRDSAPRFLDEVQEAVKAVRPML